MNRLLKFSLLCLIALGGSGCHEARVTGPTQCFAPHGLGRHQARVVQASAIVKGEVSASTTADNASF